MRVATLASLDLVKCSSSVLAKSNCIAFWAASSYSLATSLSSILTFLFRLLDVAVREMLLI